jgi:ornithine carbamoyltransferase
MEIRLAHPPGYAPNDRIVARARELAGGSGGRLSFGHDPYEAVRGASVVYTDAWTSMGQEAETEERRDAFAGYQVDDALLDAAADDVVAMHCLPAHRGEEITSAVMDGPRSLIWEQSENRLHVQKGLLVELLGGAVAAA